MTDDQNISLSKIMSNKRKTKRMYINTPQLNNVEFFNKSESDSGKNIISFLKKLYIYIFF